MLSLLVLAVICLVNYDFIQSLKMGKVDMLLLVTMLCQFLTFHIGCFGEVEKIVWNVVKLTAKDRANVNINVALDTVRNGKVVGLPTDTVYGMVADATKPRAVERLYNITGPNLTHQPITVVLDTLDQLGIYADLGTLERSMLGQLLPGRVTVVLRRKPGALAHLNIDSDLLPIRIPGHKEKIFIRKLANLLGKPLVLVGARKVGRPHSRVVDDFEDIRLRAYVVFDSGKLENRRLVGSTIVDLSNAGRYKILWPGSVEAAVVSIVQRYELEEWADGPNITVFNPT